MPTGQTRIIGVIGDPIAHTLSPAMHNAACEHLGLGYIYLPFQVHREELAGALEGIKALNFIGINVTLPHKTAVLPFLDQIAPEAELIGAVNTIHNVGGRLIGYNTDGQGFVHSLLEGGRCSPKGKIITILGTGGAARAVAVQLALEGAAQLFIVGRNLQKAEEIAAAVTAGAPRCRVSTGCLEEREVANFLLHSQILVHATPVGMYPHVTEEPVVSRDLLHRDLLVCDLIYNPFYTKLLSQAAAKGCATLSGLGMLVWQGALAFNIWTGREAPKVIPCS
jgi:shikimate dehydrogenase